MDLGCIDMGCLEKRTNEASLDSETKSAKNKATREAAQPSVGALNKFTSQIKKPPHRKGSPINWFPRKKVDSYLKRKIKLLQEVGGMNATLGETLGDANPHYSKVLKEKMAVREAAHKAMETRKAAMVEASWCRVLQAARIHSKVAEALLREAENTASEAYEAAKAIGVIMYDMPDCPQKQNEIETSIVHGGRLSTPTVTAAFETAFEVDKQVAAAVKTAFIKLANCPSIDEKGFKEILRKISENPGGKDFQDVCELSSEYESDTGSELESALNCEALVNEFQPRINKKKQVLKKLNMEKLVDLMLERLRHLQEDELASLATIVATCGLSAALAEAENDKQPGSSSLTDQHHNHSKRLSSIGVLRNKKDEPELPSLDKFLVKRLTRLEKEVQEAKDARIKENLENMNSTEKEKSVSSAEFDSDLGSVLVKKHSSKSEKKMEEAKKTSINNFDKIQRGGVKADVIDVPLDKFLVKHLSKLEREVREAKNKINIEHRVDDVASTTQTQVFCDGKPLDKENIDLNKNEKKEMETRSLDELLVKPVHRLEREKMQAPSLGNEYVSKHYRNRRKDASVEEGDSLDILVKHVSRLEKEKIEMGSKEPLVKVKRNELGDGQNSLDQILVKHKSRLEKEKAAFLTDKSGVETKHVMTRRELRVRDLQEAWGGLSLGSSMGTQEPLEKVRRLEKEKTAFFADKSGDEAKHVMTRREMRERELQEAWGGLSLGNSIRPHLSRLQRDKAAWLKAEEEEKRKHVEEEIARV